MNPIPAPAVAPVYAANVKRPLSLPCDFPGFAELERIGLKVS